jgi:hypothetical protein
VSRKAAPRLISDAASASQTLPEKRWQDAFGCPAPIRPAAFLEAAVAWREQVLAHGDIAPAIVEKLDQAAAAVRASRVNCPGAALDQIYAPCTESARADPVAPSTSLRAPRTKADVDGAAQRNALSELLPGTRLVKIHGGHTHVVEVTASGMLYQGTLYSSLSAVAKAITGTHWNGLLFFGLRKRKTYAKVDKPRAPTDG